MSTIVETEVMRLAGQEGIPEHMRDSLASYIAYGTPVGGFLQSVIENKLAQAYAKADIHNQAAMMSYARFLYHHAPAHCWGSEEAYRNWIKEGGFIGLHHKREKDG